MSLTLRPYQNEAIDAVNDAHGRGINRALIALPTGCGKTIVFSSIIQQRGGCALILAHRDELLGQAEDKLRVVAPELALSVGRVQAGRNDVDSPIVVASVQTLARQSRLDRLPPEWDTVIVDEAHHATAASYQRILDHLNAKLVVGVTATPERHDKTRLADVFQEIVYARSLLQMIEDGYLCNIQGLRVELEDLDLSEVKVSRGDYQKDDLARALTQAEAPQHTAAALAEHAPDRKSIVFVPTVALAHATSVAINEIGIRAAALSGETSIDERREILARLSSGELQAVANVDVLSEGYDEPSIDCVAIAAPTRSRIAYVQRVGRGTRLHPGKQDLLVLDLVGVTDDLKLQSLPALFDLKAPPKKGESVTDAVEREAAEAAEAAAAAEKDRAKREAAAAKRRARRADLFRREQLHWLRIGERWVLPAGGDDSLVLDPVDGGAWRVLLLGKNKARVLAGNLDLGYAQGAAEEAVREREAMVLADKGAAWRERRPSDGQLRYLTKLGVTDVPETCGEASDLINAAVVGSRLKRLDRALARRAERHEAVMV